MSYTGNQVAISWWKRNWLCKFGMHYWDCPGGHCIDCKVCDELFGMHKHDPKPEGGYEEWPEL